MFVILKLVNNTQNISKMENYSNSVPIITTGERIRLARMKSRFSQQTLAKRLGCATSTLHRWEIGVNYPPLDKVEQIAILCNLSVLYFCEHQFFHDC